jgi:hypothetical protein
VLGTSRDVRCTKVHFGTDSSGLSLSFRLSGGQAHEIQYAETLLNRVGIIRKSGHLKSCPNAVLAYKGYLSHKLSNKLKIKGIKGIKGIKAVILFKTN